MLCFLADVRCRYAHVDTTAEDARHMCTKLHGTQFQSRPLVFELSRSSSQHTAGDRLPSTVATGLRPPPVRASPGRDETGPVGFMSSGGGEALQPPAAGGDSAKSPAKSVVKLMSLSLDDPAIVVQGHPHSPPAGMQAPPRGQPKHQPMQDNDHSQMLSPQNSTFGRPQRWGAGVGAQNVYWQRSSDEMDDVYSAGDGATGVKVVLYGVTADVSKSRLLCAVRDTGLNCIDVSTVAVGPHQVEAYAVFATREDAITSLAKKICVRKCTTRCADCTCGITTKLVEHLSVSSDVSGNRTVTVGATPPSATCYGHNGSGDALLSRPMSGSFEATPRSTNYPPNQSQYVNSCQPAANDRRNSTNRPVAIGCAVNGAWEARSSSVRDGSGQRSRAGVAKTEREVPGPN